MFSEAPPLPDSVSTAESTRPINPEPATTAPSTESPSTESIAAAASNDASTTKQPHAPALGANVDPAGAETAVASNGAAAAPSAPDSSEQTAPSAENDLRQQESSTTLSTSDLETTATSAVAASAAAQGDVGDANNSQAAPIVQDDNGNDAVATEPSATTTTVNAEAGPGEPDATTSEKVAEEAASSDPADSQTAPTHQPISPPGLPRKVEEELKDIYTASTVIANFCVSHLNQVNVPAPNKIRSTIQKALSITSSLTSLMSQPEVALRQLGGEESAKRASDARLDSARKRHRSSDWDGKDGASPAGQARISNGASGLPLAPATPSSGLRVFPDGSLPTSFPSPGFDGDLKGPQYKKRSRAPAPGSCQACGTSETPEWRRGPDGARTLCNACGLHYAKLVRKRQQQEGGPEEPAVPVAQPLVTIDELRASTKSAEAAAASGMTPSASSASLNGTPIKGERAGSTWNTPSKPPKVDGAARPPTSLAASANGKVPDSAVGAAAVPATATAVQMPPAVADASADVQQASASSAPPVAAGVTAAPVASSGIPNVPAAPSVDSVATHSSVEAKGPAASAELPEPVQNSATHSAANEEKPMETD
ncbi:hypothetical protein BCV70DRAFT_51038 [Testicularia cyperi]|uniref:GATA-type domain-containing protein n=1 Tax=Testicularia cyperi TaxID=1882483 RepID=A0A317XTW1_9BASI|nr:hypothetical protein BCV70DRAFT_51038 [Testicularia cyperi]